MKALAKASLPVLAIAGGALAVSAFFSTRGPVALCGGERFKTVRAAAGASPYIKLNAGGSTGAFLLDTGATQSLISASVATSAAGPAEVANLSLPGFSHGLFRPATFERLSLQPPGGQLGVIGTDFLSLLSVQFSGDDVFLGAQRCEPAALAAQGLRPVSQAGFFSSDPNRVAASLPNVPVVFVNFGGSGGEKIFAQIDTGYDDVKYPHSVDINSVLLDRIRQSGAVLELVGQTTIATCNGSELRPVYKLKAQPLLIQSETGEPIRRILDFYLTVKAPNNCGGIATMTAPAAQLGASFLKSFGTIVLDPKSETVWIEGERGLAVSKAR